MKTTDVSTRNIVAPGRVNLIGEHTDYTGGLVLPMAIPFFTTVEVSNAEKKEYSFLSENFSEARTIPVNSDAARAGNWTDYAVGVLYQLRKLGITPPPATFRISGDVPLGAGLSSSASLEVSVALALLKLSDAELPLEEIARLCQRAENEYVGSPCGIMDQFVITASTRGHALLLNTRDLTYELLPLNQGKLAECAIVIANSGVKHSVADGEYGNRRKEVEAGEKAVLSQFPQLRDLGDATLAQLTACEQLMPAESFLRCRHIVTENQRVREAGVAMQAGDAESFGRLMTAAHESYRDDFQASIEEVDFLVNTALTLDGCFGARLTGGGFGGCIVALVKKGAAESFSRDLQAAYLDRYNLKLDTWTCDAVDGAVAQEKSKMSDNTHD